METGCQNNQLCITIIRMAFPPAAVGTLFLFPMVYVIFQFTEAVLLIVIFRCHEHWAKKEKSKSCNVYTQSNFNPDSGFNHFDMKQFNAHFLKLDPF